jgi:acyl carrier protein
VKPEKRQGLRQLLSQCPEQQRAEILGEHLHAETLRILGLDSTQRIDFDTPLVELGLDSLMAVEMRNALNNAMEQNLPATLLFDYPTIQSLCTFLLETLGMGKAVQSSETAWDEEQESTDDLLRRIETMADDEVDRLINKKDLDT